MECMYCVIEEIKDFGYGSGGVKIMRWSWGFKRGVGGGICLGLGMVILISWVVMGVIVGRI